MTAKAKSKKAEIKGLNPFDSPEFEKVKTESSSSIMKFNDLPYRGVPFARREDDPEEKQPTFSRTSKVKVFSTSNEQHMEEYREVLDNILRGEATLLREDIQFIAAEGEWKIFFAWADLFYTTPKALTEKDTDKNKDKEKG